MDLSGTVDRELNAVEQDSALQFDGRPVLPMFCIGTAAQNRRERVEARPA